MGHNGPEQVTYRDDNCLWAVCMLDGEGVGDWGDECSVNGGDGERLVSKHFSNLFLKALTEGVVTTETGSLFQYFTSLTENADPFLRRWLALWKNL